MTTPILLALASLAVLAAAAPAEYEIKSLPGWSGALPSRMYSGFTTPKDVLSPNGKAMSFHWWFVESEGNPSKDPVVLWYNGGPGASSLFGLLVELGPLLLNELSLENDAYNKTGIPQLIRNEFSWTKKANILAVDNPPPVGYSNCEDPTGGGYSCGPWNDTAVAVSNHAFIAEWIQQFPEFASNPMYITGESYAGVYVPTIVREIVKDPRGINIAGFAVGDGCMGLDVLCGPVGGPFSYIEFMHGHGQVSEKLYKNITATCPEANLKNGTLSPVCTALVNEMTAALGGYYDYNLYDECVGKRVFTPNPHHLVAGHPTSLLRDGQTTLTGAVNDYPCPSDAMNLWINRTDVKLALNVAPDAIFFSGDNGVGFNYTLTESDVLPFYKYCIEHTKLKVLVYNGDTDPGVNSFVTQDKYFSYFDSEGIPETAAWRPWTIDGQQQMGGYVTKYASNFAYLTIRGSGHMVPEYKSEAALAFLTHFLDGTDYPPYVAPTSK